MWRHNGKMLPDWANVWGNKPRNGRYWKRWLSKMRRRVWRWTMDDDAPAHWRGIAGGESRINYKNW